ncbi:MAG: hypothetical protein WDA16_00245 [Candidatus Thermoplasmatota archaeon]
MTPPAPKLDAQAPHDAAIRRFVVLHKYLGVDVWYVEAADALSAVERVYPADPQQDGRFVDEGGQEVPDLEAHAETLSLRAHQIRRFPPGVEVAVGATGTRSVGPLGEPPTRNLERDP